MSDIFCPIIHGALVIDIKPIHNSTFIGHCCLRDTFKIDFPSEPVWQNKKLFPLRNKNINNEWDSGCWTCQGNELAGMESFRTGSLKGFGKRKDLSGPTRLDLVFDTNCNLACRSCGPQSSTFWLKHLIDNQLVDSKTPIPPSRADYMIDILKTLDLTHLESVLFCGGETLLGNTYWKVAKVIADLVPNAKDQLVISFQSNATQMISEKHFDLIERFKLVKVHFSIDGIREKFEYLRWPASWNQVVDNVHEIRATAPSNVMFSIEETLGCLNLFYHHELETWAKKHFSANRFGDRIDHTTHHMKEVFALDNLTKEYVDALPGHLRSLVNPNWKENPEGIRNMIKEINKFDAIRNEDWSVTFPEVYEFYRRYH